MSLALVALLGAPADAGTWLFTLQAISPTPTGNPGPRWTAPSPSSGAISTSYNTWISNTSPTTVSLDLCVTATWQAANAQDLAPTQVPILETATAGYGVTGGGQVNWLPDDGLGDVPVVNYNSVQRTTNGMTQGLHLRICDGSSGTFTFTRALSVTSVGTNPAFVGSGSVSYRVAIDSRAVTISCPLVDTSINGGSKYRFPALTGPITTNWRLSDGTLRGDTVKPTNVITRGYYASANLSYHANVAGSWGGGSSYLWRSINFASPSDPIGLVDTGTFTLPGDPPFDHSVSYASPTFTYGAAATQATDHVYIHLTDTADGANATANYYTTFHDEWEPASWPSDGPAYTVSPIPDPEVPSWPTYPWELTNPSEPLYYNDLAGDDVTIAPAGFKDVDGGLDLGADPVVANFGFSYQPEDEVTVTKHLVPTPPVPKLYQTWPVYRPQVNRTKGHLDHYGIHGYISGHYVWRKDEKVGWQIRLYDYQLATAAVTAPPPNWNPQ